MNPVKNNMNQYKFESGFNIKLFVITISVLLLISYGIFNARNLIMGPTIEIFNPTEISETSENLFIVKGIAKNIAFLSLNEKPIFTNTEGMFQEKLLLSPGFNIIEIRAKDRFKKEILKTIKIYYKQDIATSTNEVETN